jgi:hypothetical protein
LTQINVPAPRSAQYPIPESERNRDKVADPGRDRGDRPAACGVSERGVGANDRIKFAFSLLQMALAHGVHPDQPAATLQRERIACCIDDPDLDTVVAGARLNGKFCRLPGAARIIARIAGDMRSMAAPVLAMKPDRLAARLDVLLGSLPATDGDLVDPEAISAMMRAGHDGADSLHRLVMDLHKRLNAMQAALAEETLDGAAAYNLAASDRPLVTAFMAGINRTAKLKFAHSGVATTATRAGGRLVIQNDIGTTDAHVIVIHVQDLTVSVNYTDVHPERLAFFQGLAFGAARRPLLVSVRSGAAVSMPGMLETVLDVGLSAETVEGLIRLTGNPRLAWDSYRRLVQGYAEVAANLPTARLTLWWPRRWFRRTRKTSGRSTIAVSVR